MPDNSKSTDNSQAKERNGGPSSSTSTPSTPKDSPAFRLRPRRSTSKPSPLGSIPGAGTPGRKASALFAKNSPFFDSKVKFEPQSFEAVKKKLLQYLKRSSEDSSNELSESKRKKIDEEVVKEGVNMGIFLPRIFVTDLAANQEYSKNYVSLQVVSILKRPSPFEGDPLPVLSTSPSNKHDNWKDSERRQNQDSYESKESRHNDKKEHKDRNHHQAHHQAHSIEGVVDEATVPMVLLTRDAGKSEDNSSPCLRVYAYGEYADKMSQRLEEGNVIEVTKFTTINNSTTCGVKSSSSSNTTSPSTSPRTRDKSTPAANCDISSVHNKNLSINKNSHVLSATIVVRSESSSSASFPTASTSSSPNDTTSFGPRVPLVSIKKKYESIDNLLLLKVSMIRRPETPSPGLRFSSKCLRPEDIKREPETTADSQQPQTTSTQSTPSPNATSTSTGMRQPAGRMTRRSCSTSAATVPSTLLTTSSVLESLTCPSSRCATRRSHSQSSATPPSTTAHL